jgi:hypothetical protein
MKKRIGIIILLIMVIFTKNVKASEKKAYINKENVAIPIEKYNNLIKMGFTSEMIENISQEDFNNYGDLEFIGNKSEEKYFREVTFYGYK